MRVTFFICILVIVFTSCQKDSGEGGTSVIEGQVYKIFTSQDPFSGEWDTAYLQLDPGKDVFIIYSDNEGGIYDDNFETDYNGRYHFEYLRQGDYTIYTYADSTDNSNVKYDYPIFKHIKISSNNSTNIVEDFIIEENQ
tara:strand:- start:432 stop:848 length:417 start_codon:yes stop_codon:yes gene_type:complete